MVERVLLLMNQSSGTGHSPAIAGQLVSSLRKSVGTGTELAAEVVEDHPTARRLAREFMAASPRPGALIVAGGGGTLRAAVEGVCDTAGQVLPGANQVRIAALRMGSGNVIARRLGVAHEPLEGIAAVAASLRGDRTTPCAVIRCRMGTASGGQDVRHAVTMCGLGQFGRTPGDLARWHSRFGRQRRALASVAGIERLNNLEYIVSAGGRMIGSMAYPPRCEVVEVTFRNRTERFRLLAGAVMNFPVRGIPFDAGVAMDEAAAAVRLLPWGGRIRAWRLGLGDRLDVAAVDRESIELFLDEDPESAYGSLSVEVAGMLAFVPGSASMVAA
jgi:Diacylglycerol kinase catalytic domain